jgi:hypothetical protein
MQSSRSEKALRDARPRRLDDPVALPQLGECAADFLPPEKAAARYFIPPRRDLPPPPRTSIVYASK